MIRECFKRCGFSLVAFALPVLGLLIPVGATAGVYSSDCFSMVEQKYIYDLNDTICISGTISGTPELIGVCADVYIMSNRTWSGGETLSDAMGSENRICSYIMGGGIFDEVIALPGKITLGKYDIIVDGNQDGKFNAGDEVVEAGTGYAFEVRDLGHPPVDASAIAAIKSGAHGISQGYTTSISQFNAFVNALNVAGIGLSLFAGDPMGAAIGVFGLVTGIPTSYNDWAISRGQDLIGAFDPNSTPQKATGIYGNLAKKWYDLYEDPADSDYTTFATLDFSAVNSELAATSVPGSYPFSVKGSDPREAALVEIANRSVEQAAIVKALTSSYEKYQGAYAASDYEYCYRQLERVQYFSGLLADSLNATKTALQAYKDAVAAAGLNTFVYDVSMMAAMKARITASGLSADEIASLKSVGFSDSQVALVEASIKAMEVPAQNFTSDSALTAQINLIAPTVQAVQNFSAAAGATMTTLAAEFVKHYPTANAGGPYSGYTGQQITLEGGASSDPDVGDALSYAWDLNNDGVFDDATGKTVLHTWNTPFTGMIALKVTDTTANSAVAYAKVAIASTNHAPVITSFTPGTNAPRASALNPVTFTVAATDPDGDPLSYEWAVDGAPAGAGTSYTLTPPADTKGTKRVMVTVHDDHNAQAVDGRLVTLYIDCDPTDPTTLNTYYRDADGDSFGDPATSTQGCTAPGGYVANSLDCDDGNAAVGKATTTFYRDADGDGVGNPAVTAVACSVPAGYVTNGSDCNDANAAIGVATQTFYADADADGFGNPASSVIACSQPPGYVANNLDCNDNNPAIGNTLSTYYADADADGYGDANVSVQACLQPAGYVANSLDCNDANPFVNPAQQETAHNGIDEDCSAATPDNWSKAFVVGIDDPSWIYYAKSNGDGTFSNFRTIDTLDGSTSRGIVIEDFNNDGYLDFVAGRGNGSIYLFINDGSDTFTNLGVVGTHPSPGGYIMDMGAGDFNNDGLMDFVANANTTTTAIFLNDGKGGFTRSTITLPYTGRGLDVGDFDADGNLDLAVSFYSTNNVYVYKGDGTGKFAGGSIGAATSSATDNYAVAAADFDNDGKTDIIVSGSSNGDAYFFKGNGNGSFVAGISVPSLDIGTHSSMDAYDLNNDGKVDVVLADYGSSRKLSFFPGKGDGTFGARVDIGAARSSFLSVSAPPSPRRPAGFPVAVAYAKKGSAPVGANAVLDGSFSYDPGGSIVSYGWTFGDGGTATEAKPAHAYAAEGKYPATLTVTDDAGHKTQDTALVTAVGAPPVANAGGPYVVGEAQATNARYTVNFDASLSSDDFGVASYRWDFGDGLADDFSAASGYWTPLQGTWAVDNGTYRQTAVNLDRTDTFTGNIKSGDYTVEADVMLLAGTGQEGILLVRGQDKDNHYEFIFRGRGYNDVLFYRYVNGGSTPLDTASLNFALQLNKWYRLKVEAYGSTFKCYVDGVHLLTATDSTYPAGKVGFSTYLSDARFDNLTVSSAGTGAKPTHLYAEGSYTATVTVADKAGQTSSATASVQTVKGNPPVAAFKNAPYTFGESYVNSNKWTVTLDGTASTDDTGIESYSWNFGDNSTGTGPTPSHVYTGAGTYTVTLTVTDHSGLTNSASTTVTTKGNQLPVSNPGGPYAVDEHAASAGQWTVAFDGKQSSDDFGIYDYQWSFGDGGTATGATPTHAYSAAGVYTVTLTVRDQAFQSNSASTTTTVSVNATPVARSGDSYSVDEGAAKDGLWTVNFDASASSDDFGIWKYDWNFGDGSTGTGLKPVHQYAATGVYTATLTVTDNGRQTNAATTQVTVSANQSPVANAGGVKTAEVGFPVALDAGASTDDFGIRSYQWSFDLPTWSYTGLERSGTEALIWGDGSNWNTRYLVSDTLFTRSAGDSYTGRVVPYATGTPEMMWGLKNSGTDYNYTQFSHSIYFNNGNIHIYEGSTNRGVFGTFTKGTSYDVRIDTKSTGATYYYRVSGAPSWTKLYEGTTYSTTPLRIGATVHNGLFAVSDFATPQGALPLPPAGLTAKSGISAVYNVPGTYTANVTVTDHASQTNTASTSITVLPGEPPVAKSGGPYLTNEDIPTRFNARASTDDYGIRWYGWDFGDGESIVTRNPWVDHRYTQSGVYTVTLTVTDFAGHSASDSTTATVSADPVVACVPWQFSGGIEVPHDSWSGKAITLKGVAWSLHAPLTYQWEFGDGSPPVSGTVADKNAIAAPHTYTGVDGQPFVATLTVTDANGKTASDQYLVRLRAKSIDIEINVAIDEGLWWLHTNETRASFAKGVYGNATIDAGYWDNSGGWNGDAGGGINNLYTSSPTASAVQAFQVNGHLELGDVKSDPYVETVARGLRFATSRMAPASINTQTYGDPDTNKNGIGVQTVEGRPVYEMGQVMDSIVSSGSPSSYAITGPDGVKGRSYFDLVTDMSDMYSWGQSDNTTTFGGGWRYSWNSDSDNSAAQWGAIGMLGAEEVWKIQAPRFVKERNSSWLSYSYDGTGFGYTGPGNGVNTTPSGLVQLAFDDMTGYDDPATGADERDSRWKTAEDYIANRWSTSWWYPNSSLNNRFSYYGYYAFAKAMRSAKPQPVVNLHATGLDWYKNETLGMARRLVNRQLANGSWPMDQEPGSYVGYDLTTAWSVIILTPTLFVQPPVADAGEDRVWGVGVAITLDGSRSYHLDPFRKIVLYEWDVDGDGKFDTSSTEPTTTFTYTSDNYPVETLPRTVTVTLRVTDNNDPPKSATDSAKLVIAVPPHPPVANAGGPYHCFVGVTCQLDGSGSFDIDPFDEITSHEWDINVDQVYGDLSGATPATVFTTPGVKNIGLRVTDNGVMNNGVKLEGYAFTTVNVLSNTAPVAVPGGPYDVDEGSAVILDGSGSSDPDGNTLTYAWDLDNDGTFESAGKTQSFSRPDNGSFTVSLKVSDGALESVASTTVTAHNVAPVVTQPAAGSINEGGNYGAAGSFTDPGADTWTATVDYGDGSGVQPLTLTGKTFALNHGYAQSGPYTITVVVTDKDGGMGTGTTALTVGNVAPVVNAGPDATLTDTRSFASSGSFTDPGADSWTATVNYGDGTGDQPLALAGKSFTLAHDYAANGTFTVLVTVRDSDGATGSDTALVTINNQAPAVNAGPDTATTEGTGFASSGSFSDQGSSSWSATVDYGDGTGVHPLTLNADKTFALNHVYPQDGAYTVTVAVIDNDGGTGTDTAVVTVGNVPPVVDAGPDASIAAGGTFSSSGSFSDPGADAWTGTVDYGDGSGTQALPLNANKTFILNHPYGAAGNYTVTVTVKDNGGGSGSDTALVTVKTSSCLTTLVARAKTTMVQLNWSATEHTPTTQYDIYRSTAGPDSGFVKIRSGYTNLYPLFVDTGLTNGITYYYRVEKSLAPGAQGYCSSPVVSGKPLLGR